MMNHHPRRHLTFGIALLAIAGTLGISMLPGCSVFGLMGAMGQAHEDQKLIEVDAKYKGLEDQIVAVIVNADLGVRYQYPDVSTTILTAVSARLRRSHQKTVVIDPRFVLQWQHQTPNWESLSYGEMAEGLGAKRLIYIDIYEYRLNPPGNRYLWDGMCAATVGIVEDDGLDVDYFYETFDVQTKFPDQEGVDRSQASAQQIQTGLYADFIKRVHWLFVKHEEPKYPNRYRPELDR